MDLQKSPVLQDQPGRSPADKGSTIPDTTERFAARGNVEYKLWSQGYIAFNFPSGTILLYQVNFKGVNLSVGTVRDLIDMTNTKSTWIFASINYFSSLLVFAISSKNYQIFCLLHRSTPRTPTSAKTYHQVNLTFQHEVPHCCFHHHLSNLCLRHGFPSSRRALLSRPRTRETSVQQDWLLHL